MKELEEIGVDQFAIYLMHDQQHATLQAYAGEVRDALSGAA
jgi:hypothetical protein